MKNLTLSAPVSSLDEDDLEQLVAPRRERTAPVPTAHKSRLPQPRSFSNTVADNCSPEVLALLQGLR